MRGLSFLLFTLLLALAVLAILLFALGLELTLRFAEKPRVMLCVLLKIFGSDTVIAKLRISGKLVVLVDDLLRGTAHLAFGAGAVENPVDNVSHRARTVTFVPRT